MLAPDAKLSVTMVGNLVFFTVLALGVVVGLACLCVAVQSFIQDRAKLHG
jgi:hypothetical protein